MHTFAVGIGLDSAARERVVSLVQGVGEEFRLDPATLWKLRSRSGDLVAAGVHHAAAALGARRCVALGDDRAVLYDGLPIEGSGLFPAHDAHQLDKHWTSLPPLLEGQFCALRLDLVKDQAEILCDPIGILPVFYARRDRALVVSTSAALVTSLLGIVDIDRLAIASFVALGWAVERRTFHDGVRALAGGSLHRVDATGIRSHQHYGAGRLAPLKPSPISTQELAERLVGLSSAAARAGGTIRCALTAGRDTRVMAALLQAAGLQAEYYTSGEPDAVDVTIATQLARRFGLAHEVETPIEAARDWATAASRFIRQTDGLSSLVQIGDYIELDEPVEEVQLTFWGVGGEIGRAGTGALSNVAPNLPLLSRLPQAQRRLLALKIDDQGLLTESGRALVTDFLKRFVEERRREGWPTREITEAFYAFERVASWGATGPRRAAGVSDLFSPFCTRPFVDYCFSLKPGERYLEAPHHRLLRALNPAMLEHAFEHPFHPQRRSLVALLAIRQLVEAVRTQRRHGAPPSTPAASGPTFLDRWLEPHIRLVHTFAERAPGDVWQIVDRGRLMALLSDGRAQRASFRDTLLRIATPLWLLGDEG